MFQVVCKNLTVYTTYKKYNLKNRQNLSQLHQLIIIIPKISGEGGSVILWDAAARKAKWSHVLHGEIVNCVTVSTVTGKEGNI